MIVHPQLRFFAEMHYDLEQQRIMAENRFRTLTKDEPDDDGVMRGHSVDPTHPDASWITHLVDQYKDMEHMAELKLKGLLRLSDIHPWVKSQVGLGEKQFARLLGAIGDPYWNAAEDKPRTVSQLWAYSGLHVLDGEAARRKKGVQSNWSTDAKMRAYLCATSCIKQAKSPYRDVYLARRERTAVSHPEWTAGHSHNDGLRVVSKEILKMAWREARRLHGVEEEELQNVA